MNRVFDIAGSAMAAQSVRLNTVASNVANADTAAGAPGAGYRARSPVFAATLDAALAADESATPGVRVVDVVEQERPARIEHRPGHPLADADGNVYVPNIEVMEQLADLMSASRTYETNVEVLNTARQLLLRTLQIGR